MDTSRSTYYGWLHRSPPPSEKEDQALTEIIVNAFNKSRATYGTRRLKQVLSQQNQLASRRRIGRLMRNANLACKTRRKFKATTNSKHNHPVAENHLDRQFAVNQPNCSYAGDITYIYTQEGCPCLAVVIDLFSRQIVGWSMTGHMRTKLVNDALLMAICKRKPAKGLLWHADRGSQYASEGHGELLKQYGIRQSMSRKGNCRESLPLGYDAVSESFFHTLKTELIHQQRFLSREGARRCLNILKYFTTGGDYIQPMAICRQ